MTKTIRNKLYHSLLHKTIPYFDDVDHSVGQLIEILASQAKELNGASAELYILFYQGCVAIIAC